MRDLTKLVEGVQRYVREALAPIIDRLKAVEERPVVDEATFAPKLREWFETEFRGLSSNDVPVLVERTVGEAVAKIRVPEDGKDADQEAITAQAIAASTELLPVEVARQLENMVPDAVQQAVAALPPPEPGKDADPVSVEDVARALEPIVRDQVKAAVDALPPAKDADEVDVDAMRDSVMVDVLRALPAVVAESVAHVPALVKEATAGIPTMLENLVGQAVAALPAPKDGESPTSEAVAAALAPMVEERMLRIQDSVTAKVSDWALDFEKRAHDLFQRAIDRMPKPQDGADGLGFDDFRMEHDGERCVSFILERGGVEKRADFIFPVVLDRGYFLPGGGKEYEPGDGVTFGGSFWIAQTKTTSKPEVGNDDWRLAVRKGREGKSVKGDPGKDRVIEPKQLGPISKVMG